MRVRLYSVLTRKLKYQENGASIIAFCHCEFFQPFIQTIGIVYQETQNEKKKQNVYKVKNKSLDKLTFTEFNQEKRKRKKNSWSQYLSGPKELKELCSIMWTGTFIARKWNYHTEIA